MRHLAFFALSALLACTGRPLDAATDSASSTDGASEGAGTTGPSPTTAAPDPTTAAPDPSTGVVPDPSTTSGSTTTEGANFVSSADMFREPCDIFDPESCAEGHKCSAFSNDGGSAWNDLKCFPIAPNPKQMGEPCDAGPHVLDGKDDCDLGLMCWFLDPDTGEGTCIGNCLGSIEDPSCADPQANCAISGSGVLAICIPSCDPITSDCPQDEVCVPLPSGEGFACTLDASGDEGQAFDPCSFPNACDPGLLCTSPEVATECDPSGDGCCTPYCDVTGDPDACPGADQSCVPFWGEGQAPPGLENIGACSLPL